MANVSRDGYHLWHRGSLRDGGLYCQKCNVIARWVEGGPFGGIVPQTWDEMDRSWITHKRIPKCAGKRPPMRGQQTSLAFLDDS